ncbi:appetite-regulating hormone [Pelobates cultripes]|uniref:Appetite-regulating hormone n=1 Tax=Pelobates cultripes TaxID=61616 RepID=A0AAD1SYU0_PELCU|nr:appetite-regulating hormone [Pelobates cultripes]
MMLARATVYGIVLFCLLWIEETQAGSSFLSPADMQKNSGKRPPKKMVHSNIHRREVGDTWDSPLDQLIENQMEIGFKFPLDINLKMTEEQFQQQKAAIQEILFEVLSLSTSQDTEERNE